MKQFIESEFEKVNKRLDSLEEDVGTLKEDVGTLKEDVGTLKEDVGTLKEDVFSLKKFALNAEANVFPKIDILYEMAVEFLNSNNKNKIEIEKLDKRVERLEILQKAN